VISSSGKPRFVVDAGAACQAFHRMVEGFLAYAAGENAASRAASADQPDRHDHHLRRFRLSGEQIAAGRRAFFVPSS